MGIMGVLMAMSFAAYQNLQTTIRLNEYTNNLEQNIRKVQRDAMLLEKKPGESWIYGLGIDLTKMNKPESFGQYEIFKWCSGLDDYGDRKTTYIIPDFDPEVDGEIRLDRGPGSLPNNGEIHDLGNCSSDNELKKYSLFGDSGVGTGIDVKPPESKIETNKFPYFRDPEGYPNGFSGNLGYILFEAVTGRAFFYSSHWKVILNTDNKGNPLSKAQNLEIKIKPLRGGKGKKITVFNISGRVLVEGNDE